MALQYIGGVELGRSRADRQAARAARRAGRQAARDIRRGGSDKPRLVDTKPNLAKVKLFPLGFDEPTTGLAFSLSAVAQNPFEPIRGVMQASGGDGLDTIELTQLDIGSTSQLCVKNKRFPSKMFDPTADDVLCDLTVLPPGITFSMEGFNEDAETQRVLAGWYGWWFESVNLG